MNKLKQKILAEVEEDLSEIETALRENLNPHFDLVRETASHILFSGGKRLRPLLMVLCGRLCGYSGDYDKIFSVVFEYLHAATLLHDDLVDGASLRRGKPTAHSVWDNSTAVLVGDFLLARSLSIGTETGNLKIIRIISEITENMSQGEIRQLMRKGNLKLSEAEYMDIIRCKNAVLIQGACRVGALIADAGEEEESALSAYGFNLGIAFQMADDLLDYTSDSGTLGKNVGADLKEGKLTLPVISSLEAADPIDRDEMEEIIKNKDFSLRDFERLVEMLEIYGGIRYTKHQATRYVEQAKEAISIFKNSKTKQILLNIADFALSRKH
ncbi:polyprenyl synthetase family protein [Desulfobacterales bacterium HSG2]|nr:polyprenyl synthetase family protein [Desulfobacterales bacterium HSG2]